MQNYSYENPTAVSRTNAELDKYSKDSKEAKSGSRESTREFRKTTS